MEVSHSYRNRLSEPLTEAVYWSEYIAENGGNLLRSHSALQLNFFNYHSFDVIMVLLFAMFVTIFLLIKAITKLWMWIKDISRSDKNSQLMAKGRASSKTKKFN